jgi:benzoyl-CoA 2,3-dioxygenase component A
MQATENGVIDQHLIDPEICIRCNTCEATCPVGAITHDDNNYVVNAEICNLCMACIAPCPTGSIDNWRKIPISKAYSLQEQYSWESLPSPLSESELSQIQGTSEDEAHASHASPSAITSSASSAATTQSLEIAQSPIQWGSVVPPWSAAHPYVNLHGAKNPITATVVGNVQVNEPGTENETHHVVLDMGHIPFPVLEGQSIGIIPPGLDAKGKPHHARQYSIASARNGERAGYNNLSLTVKRVTQDPSGQPFKGLCSNFICDLKIGDQVNVMGPFGTSFLMPNHPKSNIVMICTGTGSAPMRAMTEWRRRLRQSGKFEGGKLMLFFGARTQAELPYFGPLQKLPKDFLSTHFAYSRTPGQPRKYVQDLLRERSADLVPLLKDSNTYFYVCGLKSMEVGVIEALRDIAQNASLSWDELGSNLKKEGRLHLETY